MGWSVGLDYSIGLGYSLSGPGYSVYSPFHSTSIIQKGLHVIRELHILENKQIDTGKNKYKVYMKKRVKQIK